MATFTPPTLPDANPNSLPSDSQMVKRAMSHFSRGDRNQNVWILTDGTAQSFSPAATYNADGTLALSGLERTVRFFQGGVVYTVTAAEETILNDSGYSTT